MAHSLLDYQKITYDIEIFQALPMFFVLGILELFVVKLTKKENVYDVSDTMTSLGSGILQQLLQ